MIHIWSYLAGVVISSFAYGYMCMLDDEKEEYANVAAIGIILWPVSSLMLAFFWIGCWVADHTTDDDE